MKILLVILGGLLAGTGAVWIFQGINVLLGSFMSGQPVWAVIGAGALVLGGTLIFFGARRKKAK